MALAEFPEERVILTRTHNKGYRPYGTFAYEVGHKCRETSRKAFGGYWVISYACGQCSGLVAIHGSRDVEGLDVASTADSAEL